MQMRNLILMRTLDVTGPSLVNGATLGKRSSNQEKQKKTFFSFCNQHQGANAGNEFKDWQFRLKFNSSKSVWYRLQELMGV